METEQQKTRRTLTVTPPGVQTPPAHPCPRCQSLGRLPSGRFCPDCPHGEAARQATRKAYPRGQGLASAREIAEGMGLKV